MPKETDRLIEEVLTNILPLFEKEGLIWHSDYANGESQVTVANEIPLQKREGELWPTVTFRFGKSSSPWVVLYFSILPEECKRFKVTGQITELANIHRDVATVFDGPAYFSLQKGKYRDYVDREFGYSDSLLMPIVHPILYFRYKWSANNFIDAQIDELVNLLPNVFDIFKEGIPDQWLTRDIGYVSSHVMLVGSWYIGEQRLGKGD